jgi:hypothetical protein
MGRLHGNEYPDREEDHSGDQKPVNVECDAHVRVSDQIEMSSIEQKRNRQINRNRPENRSA